MNKARMRFYAGLAACLLCAAVTANAALMSGLYDASVPVPDQTAAARKLALQQALAAVLVKITGDRNAPSLPNFAAALKDPSQFLQQYSYQQDATAENGTAPPAVMYDLTRTGTPAIPLTGLSLWAKFDPDVLNHAVRSAGEPLWGQERPVTLVWLAIDDGGNKTILSASNNPAVMKAMTDAAGERGIALLFPRMDAQDQQDIGYADITGDAAVRIQQASQVYKADATLVGTIYMTTPGQYAARWQLTSSAGSQSWTATPDTLANVAAGGVQAAADDLAQWLAVAAGATGINGVVVSVSGITDLDAYAKVMAFFSSLTTVKGVQVTRVAGNTVYYSLDTRGSVENLSQAALLGGILKLATPAPPAGTQVPSPSAALHFQYAP
ncbi:MAG: DUF2066 domain-containing protein [Gammaproteobacteria bacterium]|nr:DUF2066 domain-containing protein [Gammaproteobacteria bacterium]